ncbi:MAG: hypothetical protein HYS12_24155 [Planctomycetes bacterium]|nr:hypothetical protein [Planctomycetota bacterium]
MSSVPNLACPLPERRSLIDRLNAEWHKPALLIYTGIVLLHWGEHLLQAFQVYVLGWPLKEGRDGKHHAELLKCFHSEGRKVKVDGINSPEYHPA